MKTITEYKEKMGELSKKLGDIRALCVQEQRDPDIKEVNLMNEIMDEMERIDSLIQTMQRSQQAIDSIEGHIVPVCPEQLSGLSTPRKPVEIQGGDGFAVLRHQARVVSQDGQDFTDQFLRGAQIVLGIAKMLGAVQMITQFRSPSCSSGQIYDGRFCHTLKPGFGVCAALLQLNGIELVDIDDLLSPSV